MDGTLADLRGGSRGRRRFLFVAGTLATAAAVAAAVLVPGIVSGLHPSGPTPDAGEPTLSDGAAPEPRALAKGDRLVRRAPDSPFLVAPPPAFPSVLPPSAEEAESGSQAPAVVPSPRHRPQPAIVLGPDDLAAPVAPPGGKHLAPIPASTLALMAGKNTSAAAPILIRTYKKEAELEVWKRDKGGRFVLVKAFPICRWSGQLGPKMREGDRQTPEGFYAIRPTQMNPNSAYYLSFDVGYPNAFDLAHGATGSAVMVHGTCSSRGCYAMTDKGAAEIYALAREAFAGGQKAIQFQAYPFRMTAENMVRYRADQHIDFWRQLKEGSDRFEALGEELVPTVDGGRYAFKPSPRADKESQVAARRAAETARVASLTAEGRPAVRTTYSDGGQNGAFRALARRGFSLGNVSRPEALAFAGEETVVIASSAAPGTARAPRPSQRAAHP